MKTTLQWQHGMMFDGLTGSYRVTVDAKTPLGHDLGPTPKELLLIALSGCTAMDVIGLLSKHKSVPERFEVLAEASSVTGRHPAVFNQVDLLFRLSGDLPRELVIEAVRLSQSKYCSVSAMLAKAVAINYSVELNGERIGEGSAEFIA